MAANWLVSITVFSLVGLNIGWDCPVPHCIAGSRDRWELPTFFRRHWQSLCTALTAGKCLSLGLCKGTGKIVYRGQNFEGVLICPPVLELDTILWGTRCVCFIDMQWSNGPPVFQVDKMPREIIPPYWHFVWFGTRKVRNSELWSFVRWSKAVNVATISLVKLDVWIHQWNRHLAKDN